MNLFLLLIRVLFGRDPIGAPTMLHTGTYPNSTLIAYPYPLSAQDSSQKCHDVKRPLQNPQRFEMYPQLPTPWTYTVGLIPFLYHYVVTIRWGLL
jgi:hypothetical protein